MTSARPLGPEFWRIVKIFSRDLGDTRRVGSGYLVSAGRVLTAAHVVQNRQSLELVIDNGGLAHRLTVKSSNVWVESGMDLGIVEVDPDWVEMNAPQTSSVAAVSFGRVAGEERIPARLYGFAAFKLRDDESGTYRDSEELDCVIRRGSNIIEKTLQLAPESPWEPDTSDHGETRWSSMSGTAVWVGDVIVAVVSQYRAQEAQGVLVAQPVERILSLPIGRQNEALDLLGLVPADFVTTSSVPVVDAGEPSSDLAVWPVPPDAEWGSLDGISGNRHAESLLTHLVLSRVPRAQIVVDPVEADLANDLNRTERAYRMTRTQWIDWLAAFQPRRWFTIDLDADPEKRGGSVRRMLLDGGCWSEAAEPAFVLRTSRRVNSVDRRAQSVLARIAVEYPESCVVIHLRSSNVVKGVVRARHVASRSAHPPMPVYLRRRHEFRRSSATLAGITTMRDLIEMLEEAATRAEQRPRLGSNAPPSSSASPDALKPRALVRRLVREIESTGIPATSRSGDDLDDALLGALRDYLPRLYPVFLNEYAAHRTGPGWAASMAFASQSDLLDSWIASAETSGAHPDERHPWPLRYGRRPYDRLAGALERGVVRYPEKWRHPIEPAGAVNEWVASDSDWEDAETWRRVAVQVPHMTTDAAMRLMCGADAAHPIVARVLGYAAYAGEGLVQERVDELRRILVPGDLHRRSHDA